MLCYGTTALDLGTDRPDGGLCAVEWTGSVHQGFLIKQYAQSIALYFYRTKYIILAKTQVASEHQEAFY